MNYFTIRMIQKIIITAFIISCFPLLTKAHDDEEIPLSLMSVSSLKLDNVKIKGNTFKSVCDQINATFLKKYPDLPPLKFDFRELDPDSVLDNEINLNLTEDYLFNIIEYCALLSTCEMKIDKNAFIIQKVTSLGPPSVKRQYYLDASFLSKFNMEPVSGDEKAKIKHLFYYNFGLSTLDINHTGTIYKVTAIGPDSAHSRTDREFRDYMQPSPFIMTSPNGIGVRRSHD